jgi:ribosome-binding protein aMBF1 (putative translation factor)
LVKLRITYIVTRGKLGTRAKPQQTGLKEVPTHMKKITKLRNENGWSRAELARRAHMHPAEVGQIEAGRFLAYETQLKKLAKALKWDGPPEGLLEEVVS